MKLRRPKRRFPYVPTTSFGDIAFLLIIFFMVASVFMREAHIQTVLPQSPDIDKVQDVPISVQLDKDGQLWLQGERCPPDALEPAVSALLGERTDRQVMVKIDRGRAHKEFGTMLKALSEAGAEIVLLGEKRGK